MGTFKAHEHVCKVELMQSMTHCISRDQGCNFPRSILINKSVALWKSKENMWELTALLSFKIVIVEVSNMFVLMNCRYEHSDSMKIA